MRHIRFTTNKRKVVEALVWIIRRGEPNLYNAMKILFAADKYHLNTYICPVTGDNYSAMRFGTVPVYAYSVAKKPPAGTGFTRKGNALVLDEGRAFDGERFSESDIEALEHGFKEYAGKSFDSVLLKNHREKAWRKAVERSPGRASSPIYFEDMVPASMLKDDMFWLSQLVEL